MVNVANVTVNLFIYILRLEKNDYQVEQCESQLSNEICARSVESSTHFIPVYGDSWSGLYNVAGSVICRIVYLSYFFH